MVISFNDLGEIRKKHSAEKIVLVGGCFDLLHVGHAKYLERCRALGNMLIVAISSDVRIKERKGEARPIISEVARADLLSFLTCVDYVTVAPDPIKDDEAPTVKIINALRPDIFATADSRFGSYKSELSKKGVETVFMEEIRTESTTHIIKRIKDLV